MKPTPSPASLLGIFFPSGCAACSQPLMKGEELICFSCLLDMPYTRMHDMEGNVIEARLYGRFRFIAATSLLFFVKNGRIQHLMHELKYKGHQEVGTWMGRQLGAQLRDSKRFAHIDYVVPVPLHPRKRKSRGFNQAEVIAEGMVQSGFEVVPDALRRVHDNTSQTRKSVKERWENVQDIFALERKELLKHKKVLLLDDVLTTGATLEACAVLLDTVEGIELYVATIACAEF